MIQIGEVILGPAFLTTITVERKSGRWENGRYNAKDPETVTMQGNLQPAGETDTVTTPEGNQIKGDIVVYVLEPIYETQVQAGSNADGISDTVLYSGNRYQVIRTEDWSLYGYWKAICTREEAA